MFGIQISMSLIPCGLVFEMLVGLRFPRVASPPKVPEGNPGGFCSPWKLPLQDSLTLGAALAQPSL